VQGTWQVIIAYPFSPLRSTAAYAALQAQGTWQVHQGAGLPSH
jgi:hypothetical protein